MGDELEFTEFQKHIVDLIQRKERKGIGAHHARNAVRHLIRAWKIREIDKEMSSFRCLTGAEEAASAVFDSLKRRKYEGAEKLLPYNHIHKVALSACIDVIVRMFKALDPPMDARCCYDSGHGGRILFSFDFSPNHRFYPLPPLSMKSSKADDSPIDYSDEIADLTKGQGSKSLEKFIARIANDRNRLLYATTGGSPEVTIDLTKVIARYQNDIFRSLAVYLMIDPYPQKQAFVQDCLDTFVPFVNKIKPPKVCKTCGTPQG